MDITSINVRLKIEWINSNYISPRCNYRVEAPLCEKSDTFAFSVVKGGILKDTGIYHFFVDKDNIPCVAFYVNNIDEIYGKVQEAKKLLWTQESEVRKLEKMMKVIELAKEKEVEEPIFY